MNRILLFLAITISSFSVAQTGITIKDSILSEGVYRYYTLYVPAIYNPSTSVPLLFNIHGGTGEADQQMAFGDFRPIADSANFIIVHPTALVDLFKGITAPVWATESIAEPNYDRMFLFNLLDTIKSKYSIDESRIYSTGFSQGGHMSYNFACFNNVQFAAIAPVATGMSYLMSQDCKPTQPTPILIIKGTEDGYSGKTKEPYRTDTDSAVGYWLAINNIDTVPTSITLLSDLTDTDNSTVEHFVWEGGDQGTSVELYKVHNGGHAWPAIVSSGGTVSPQGGNTMMIGNRNLDFNAAKEIWRFFSQYTLDGVTRIDNLTDSASDILIYPNPSNGLFTLKLEEIKNETSFYLYNIFGQPIYQNDITSQITTIDLRGVSSGAYFYQVKNKQGGSKSGKFIIQ